MQNLKQTRRPRAVDGFNPEVLIRLLAGVAGGDTPNQDAIICTCFNMGVNTLVEASETGQAASLYQIGKLLNAGANVGSFAPELASLLTNFVLPIDVQ